MASVTIASPPILQFFNNAGQPNINGTVLTQVGGVNYPTYEDAAGTVPLPNPIPLNSRGEVSNASGVSKPLYLVAGVTYVFTLYDSNNNQINQATYGISPAVPTTDYIGNLHRVVTSITALRALDKTKYTQAFVTGYYASGDGGGGAYYYDSSDVTSADNGGTIIVANDGARWKLSWQGYISVKQFGAKGDGITDDTTAIQDAFTYAYNAGVSPNKAIYFPAGTYVVSSTITAQCSIIGEGPAYNGTGTVIKWTGSAAKVFNIPTYVSGWTFSDFRIDMSNVTTDATGMYFDQGCNGACFRDLEFKGYHSGASWGGTYKNQDGIYIVGGTAPSTKYDMSQNRFERVFWTRCRNGLTVTDPSNQGPGNGCTFDGCFSWCNGWTISMTGANNTLINCEFNAEASSHAVVQAGQWAVGWVYLGCDWGTAASGDGNQPIYADTAGAADICTLIGGTLETSNGGGVPSPIKDAGATGGKVFRYLKYGPNNSDSTILSVDQIYLGQALSGNTPLAASGTWTPVWSGLDVVGSASYSGQYTRFGDVVQWSVQVTTSGGGTTASTAGTTHITNMPFTETGVAATCTASDASSLASYGVGQGATGGKTMFTPTWAATTDGIVISGFYFTDGT